MSFQGRVATRLFSRLDRLLDAGQIPFRPARFYLACSGSNDMP